MKIQILGTAAAEGWPALFCNCEACRRAREKGGKNIRTRAGTLIDDQLLIDFSADTYGNALRFGLDLSRIHTLLVTHDHEDHLYAEDLGTRYTWFAHLDARSPETLLVYGNDRVGSQVSRGTFSYGGPGGRVAFRRVVPFRTEEAHGYRWMELPELLADCDAIFTCLTKNVILMKDEQFAQFGDGKIFFNTSIAPSFETEALERWLARGGNELFCDMPSALGEHAERLLANPHVNCIGQSAGFTGQAAVRLSEKSLNNIRAFLENN